MPEQLIRNRSVEQFNEQDSAATIDELTAAIEQLEAEAAATTTNTPQQQRSSSTAATTTNTPQQQRSSSTTASPNTSRITIDFTGFDDDNNAAPNVATTAISSTTTSVCHKPSHQLTVPVGE
jgi:N-methylhydantoinase B/oxoprolinase/acetone carboxylase alpha subunit